MARAGVRELRGDLVRQGRGSPAGGAAPVGDRGPVVGAPGGRLGGHGPDLERLVAEHPLRERRWSLLVVALYRQGRQGAALEAWARARDVLADELGVDPGPELRELQRRVLAQDPALDAPTRLAARWARRRTPLLGREVELSRLRHAWDRARAGETLTVVLRGPRGSGRTRLAAELAAEAAPARRGWSATATASSCAPTLVA